mgnify:FL=1
MHVCSVGSPRLSHVPAVRVPRQSRIRYILLVTVISGLLSIGQAVAQELGESASGQIAVPAAGQTPSDRPGRPVAEGKVCQYEDVTGSRMRKRICFTPEQWDARERAAKELVRELDSKPIGRNGDGD